ncbi:MAG: hydrogenase maturation protease [Solirubrobacteraceae bacterium]|jgi:hydrogenase maturation protease
MAVVVIGVGNDVRGDDAAGLLVVRRLRDSELRSRVALVTHEGDAIGLLELWDGADAAVLVDAVCSGAGAGTVHRIDASRAGLPADWSGASSHAISAAESIELARVLGTLPRRVIVYGVEGACFEQGAPLSDDVAAALPKLADAVRAEALALHCSTA